MKSSAVQAGLDHRARRLQRDVGIADICPTGEAQNEQRYFESENEVQGTTRASCGLGDDYRKRAEAIMGSEHEGGRVASKGDQLQKEPGTPVSGQLVDDE